jgi:hypothetical protein
LEKRYGGMVFAVSLRELKQKIVTTSLVDARRKLSD